MATASASNVDYETFDFDSVATMVNYIDKGAYGNVYGPFLWNNRRCAFKRILISQTTSDAFKIKVEAKKGIWASLKHYNLLEIHHVSIKEKAVYLVMEYASGGSLSCFLHKFDVSFRVSNWARQIAEGMLFLHENGIVHRDLKSGNIMLMETFDSLNADKEVTIKVTDFDEVKEHNQTTTMSLIGTVAYMAPEVLTTQKFSKASDIWSYGVVLWEMLTRERPHEGQTIGPLIMKASTGQLGLPIPEFVPGSYKQLLYDCWHHNTKLRPTFRKIIDELNIIDKEEDTGKTNQEEEEMDVDDEKAERRQFDTDLPEKYKEDPVLVYTIRTKAQDEIKEAILGLTVLDTELFIVTGASPEVEVYDSIHVEFCFKRQWNLKEFIRPLQISSCNQNKCLYIIVYNRQGRSKEIWRVDRNGKLIKNWSTGDDDAWSLSVTDEFNVILNISTKNKLSEYSPDGQLIREIDLLSQAGIHQATHAIKLTSGNFVVSHHKYRKHRVCIVDENGNLKKSFGRKAGRTNEKFNLPYHLAVDGNGFVLVADVLNDRIVLLNSNLEFKKELISKRTHALQRPKKILLDESNGKLFVTHKITSSGEERISIFEFR